MSVLCDFVEQLKAQKFSSLAESIECAVAVSIQSSVKDDAVGTSLYPPQTPDKFFINFDVGRTTIIGNGTNNC